jgi:cytoskeletal protein CcmA (bactofilin family)
MGLFSKSKAEALSQSPAGGSGRESAFFGAALCVKGKVSGSDNIIVMGRLEGELDVNGELALAASAAVTGEIRAITITVSGNLAGNLVAREKTHLEKSALVSGRLTSPRLSVVDGACFNGELEMKKPADGAVTSNPVEKSSPL